MPDLHPVAAARLTNTLAPRESVHGRGSRRSHDGPDPFAFSGLKRTLLEGLPPIDGDRDQPRDAAAGEALRPAGHGDARKRIWATEFGWPVDPTPPPGYEYAADNSEWEQSEFTRVAFQLGREAGYVGPMFLWNLNYRIIAPESEMAMWGIVDQTWNPLQAYVTLKGLPK